LDFPSPGVFLFLNIHFMKGSNMSADATWPLQKGLFSHLRNDLSLKKHLSDPPRVFDQQEQADGFPRLVWGDSFAKVWSSATFDGQEHEIILNLWTCDGGSAVSKEIAGAVIDRLHNADFPVTGHALVDMQFSSSETRYKEELGLFHCRLTFKALTVSD